MVSPNEKSPQLALKAYSGPDGTRTRDPLRDSLLDRTSKHVINLSYILEYQ